MSTPSPFWPAIKRTTGEWTTVLDTFLLVFFLDREKCGDPGPALRAFAEVLGGIGREKLPFYVDEEGDVQPVDGGLDAILQASITRPTTRGEVAEFGLLGDERGGTGWEAQYLHNPTVSAEEWPDKKSYIFFRMPQEVLTREGPESILDLARRFSSILPYAYAYGSPALAYGEYFPDALPYLRRHPGFDVADTMSVAFDIGDHAMGPYWLNLFGPRLSAALGGTEALRAALPDKVRVLPWPGGGTCVVLGDAPDVGDVNRGNDLPLYRQLARVLRPHLHVPGILYFEDETGMGDTEAQAAWHRRFLPGDDPD